MMSGNEAHDEQINDLESQVVNLKEYIHDLEKRAVHEQQLEIEVAKLKERLYKIVGDESCGTFASYEQLFDEVAKLKEEYDYLIKEQTKEMAYSYKLKSTLDEIKTLVESKSEQHAFIRERIKDRLAKHEGSKVGEQYGKFRAEHPRCEDKK